MIEGLPAYVSLVFIATTFLTVGFLFYAIKVSVIDSFPGKLVLFAVVFWMVFQMSMPLTGFYRDTKAFPPRVFFFGALPSLIFIAALFIFFRTELIEKLPLTVLTILYVVRVPVEVVLLWLFQAGVVPQLMTFEGRNFDILSGLSAPIVYLFAFRKGQVNRTLLVIWNVVCLLLLINIVATAVLSVDSPIQRLAFDQPNRAILYFPFIWLPTIIVPIVLFSHLTSLWQLFKRRRSSNPALTIP